MVSTEAAKFADLEDELHSAAIQATGLRDFGSEDYREGLHVLLEAYDSDPLRERLAEQGFELISPHRENRVKPPTVDGRKLRRYRHRWLIERTNAWLHNFRRIVTRWEFHSFIYGGFVQLACAFIALGRL